MFIYRNFLQAMDREDYDKARTIIFNLLQDRPSSYKYLGGYVDFIEKAFDKSDVVTKEKYLELYKKSKNRFLTYGRLGLNRLTNIDVLDARVEALRTIYNDARIAFEEENKITYKKTNEEILAYLETELNQLDEVETEKEFDALLDDVKKAEKKLKVSSMDEKEKDAYDRLIDLYAAKISSRTRDFENAELTRYNIECLDSLKNLMQAFRKSRRKFISHFDLLEPLLCERMFSIDTSKLFSATSEYYEYCYAYIFTRLNNEDKYAMARLALTTPKK